MASDLLKRVCNSNYLCARLFSSNVVIFTALFTYGTLYHFLSEMLVACIFVRRTSMNYIVWCGMSEICLKLKVLAKIDFIVFLTLLGVK